MSHKIEVVGLGAGDLDQLPLGIYKKLLHADKAIYTRTLDHPVITSLQNEGVHFHPFDSYYEKHADFLTVYENIVNTLLEKAKEASLIYAVPGHPMLAEKTVQLLLQQRDVHVEIIGGQSYLDDLFTALEIDPIEGFQFVDGTDFKREELNYKQHLVFCQVYDSFVASEVKLSLLEDLPYDYEVIIIEAAGLKDEKITKVLLQDLDRQLKLSNLTSVYVPPVADEHLQHTFNYLRKIIQRLRGPDGCPWDQAQTHESLRAYALEEVYELLDAIDNEDDEGVIEELGDVLLQVMLHSQIGEDDGYFTIDDVIQGISKKMVYRHPHVFANTSVSSITDVNKNWERLKREEKNQQPQTSLTNEVPRHLPALQKAYQLQKKVAKVGFDWTDVKDVWLKLDEELAEFKQALVDETFVDIEEEFGDILFALINLARHYRVNPELALNRTNNKFISRFNYVEEKVRASGKTLEDSTLAEMDAYWNEAKRKE